MKKDINNELKKYRYIKKHDANIIFKNSQFLLV